MELKLNKAADGGEVGLSTCAHDMALAQVDRLGYGHGLDGAGLVKWGIAFCGKHVACVCERRQSGNGLDGSFFPCRMLRATSDGCKVESTIVCSMEPKDG